MSFDWLSPPEADALYAYFSDRFGIAPEAFAGHRLHRRGDTIYALAEEAAAFAEPFAVVTAGLPVARESKSGALTPSTRGLQKFGGGACRNVVEVDRETLRALAQGRSLPHAGEEGTLLLRLEGEVAGMALLRGGLLVGRLPAGMTKYLDLSTPGHLM